MTHHLVGVTEIANMLGISRQRVNYLVQHDPTFPEPEVELTGGRVWATEAIERWARETGRIDRHHLQSEEDAMEAGKLAEPVTPVEEA